MEKPHKKIQEGIEFYFSNLGNFLYAELEEIFPQIENYLKRLFTPGKVHVTGKYRRQELIIEELEFVILEPKEIIIPKFQTAQPPELTDETENSIQYKLRNGLKLRLYTGGENMAEELFKTTGNTEFLKTFYETYSDLKSLSATGESDTVIFKNLNLPFIPPCLREDGAIVEKAEKNELPFLIQPVDIRSIIHSHSNWSDGVNTIDEMADECIKEDLNIWSSVTTPKRQAMPTG